MIQKACNEFVLVLRDKTDRDSGGVILPTNSRVKPHSGTIHAIGSLVKDPVIKAGKGKKCLFHPTVGYEITFEEIVYLVLSGHEIIALP